MKSERWANGSHADPPAESETVVGGRLNACWGGDSIRTINVQRLHGEDKECRIKNHGIMDTTMPRANLRRTGFPTESTDSHFVQPRHERVLLVLGQSSMD